MSQAPKKNESAPSGKRLTAFDYVCPFCSKCFENKTNLESHTTWVHPKMKIDLKPYKCHKCTMTFFMEDGLENHLAMNH